MAWFAYISKECREAAQRHTVLPQVESLQKTVEDLQQNSLPRFYQFPPPYLVKKKFAGREGRLIAERREIKDGNDEHTVIVFLDFMTRGDPGYEKKNGFGHDPIMYGKNHYEGIVSDEELHRYIQDRRPDVKELDPPSASECGYLHGALSAHYENHADSYIYESREWNDSINQDEFSGRQAQIFEKLSEFTASEQYGPKVISIADNIQALAYYFPEARIHFIAGLGDPEIIAGLKKRYSSLFSPGTTAGDLAKHACRAYPAIVLAADYNFWRDIEKKGSGNMALSPEESQLLQGIISSGRAYPIFINGRAGSGKSTILQYLFSYYMEYYLQNGYTAEKEKRPLPPLYLTWSKTLLDTALKNVTAFLKCSIQNLSEEGRRITAQDGILKEIFSVAFRPFQSFMLEQVPVEERRFFKPDRHITYAQFVKLWSEKFGKEMEVFNLGPEICWHIIRTFIKGTNSEDFLEPEDYLDGLKKEQTVSKDTYEKVYDKVWEKWYRRLTVGVDEAPGEYWDDQDLIRYVIRHNYCNREYPVVFCDEAQDFTRIELNAILNLSLFSHRKIYSHEVPQLPFAFAGDPFQTLNPTGFRWEAIKYSFVEQFINSHHRDAGGTRVELNYCELENNYRSDPAIVKFSNHVQLLRSRALRQTIQPQKPWWVGKTGVVAYFDKEDSSFWDWAKDHPEIVFVVPCDRDGEENYWQQSGLNQHQPFPNVTVMSTIAIKGLEYSTIVACGFGEDSPAALMQYLDAALEGELDEADDAKLTVEYYINKLYVAVSRAQNRLLILDSDSGRKNLWNFFMQDGDSSGILLPRGGDGDLYLRLQPGDQRTLAGDGQISLAEEADHSFEDGKTQCNPHSMRRAKKLYDAAGMYPRAATCEAWALFFDKKYHQAAETDQDANYTLKHRCWWLEGTAESLQRILDSNDHNSDFRRSEEFRLLKDCFQPGSPKDAALAALDRIYSVYTTRAESLFELENATSAWKLLVGRCLDGVMSDGVLSDEEKKRVWDLLEKFRNFDLADNAVAGRLAFQCGHFAEAAEWLRGEKDPELVEMRNKAEQQAKPLDAQIQSAYASQNWQAVVTLYRANPAAGFSDLSMRQIAVASAVQGDASVAKKLFLTRYSPQLISALLSEKKISSEIAQELDFANQRAMIANYDCSAIEEFLKFRKFNQNQAVFFIRVFARCDADVFQRLASHELLSIITGFITLWLKFFKKNVLKQYFFEIGCALEKSNNIKVAKEFYIDNSRNLSAPDQQRALRRALICYERHAEVLDNEVARRVQLRKAEDLRKKLNLVGVKRGDPRLPEYEFGIDPWVDFRLPPKTPDPVPPPISPVVPVDPPVPNGEDNGRKPDDAPDEPATEENNSLSKDGKISEPPPTPKQKPESGGDEGEGEGEGEDLSALITDCEEGFRRLVPAESALFPLKEETIARWLENAQRLAENYRRILCGDGSDEWKRSVEAADSFAALREAQEKHKAERESRARRDAYRKFQEDLRTVISRLKLKPISNQRRKTRAEADLAEIKQLAAQAEIEFAGEHLMPDDWQTCPSADEWLRENLLVDPEQLDDAKIEAILPFDESICEKLLEWHDCLLLP